MHILNDKIPITSPRIRRGRGGGVLGISRDGDDGRIFWV